MKYVFQSSIWFQKLPEDISLDGYRIDNVIHYTDLVISIYFGIVVLALLYFMLRYNEFRIKKAVYDKGDKKRNIIITAFLGFFVFFSIDAVIEAKAFRDLREAFWNFPDHDKVVKIEVMPQQFAWNFRYPGPDSEFGTSDDIIPTQNQMHIPINRPVVVQIASWDVIHSFYLPNFRIKQDATPGMITPLWFQAIKTGVFDIACAELCGNGHYKMQGYLTVETEEEFEQWLIDNAPNKSDGEVDEWDDWDNEEDMGVPENWGWKWKELK